MPAAKESRKRTPIVPPLMCKRLSANTPTYVQKVENGAANSRLTTSTGHRAGSRSLPQRTRLMRRARRIMDELLGT
jgi:hypothetical protein